MSDNIRKGLQIDQDLASRLADLGADFIDTESDESSRQWEIGQAVHTYMSEFTHYSEDTKEEIWTMLVLALQSKRPDRKSGLSLSSVKTWERTYRRSYAMKNFSELQERYAFVYFAAVGVISEAHGIDPEKLFNEIEAGDLSVEELKDRYKIAGEHSPVWQMGRRAWSKTCELFKGFKLWPKIEPHVKAIDKILDEGES